MSGTLLIPKSIAADGKSLISFKKFWVRDALDSYIMPLTLKLVLAWEENKLVRQRFIKDFACLGTFFNCQKWNSFTGVYNEKTEYNWILWTCRVMYLWGTQQLRSSLTGTLNIFPLDTQANQVYFPIEEAWLFFSKNSLQFGFRKLFLLALIATSSATRNRQ